MDNIYRYIKEHSSGQTEALNWIERQTNIRTNHARMLSGSVQGRLLTMMTGMIQPSRVLELGTFTGYSAVCIAMGLTPGAHIDTLEINDELEDLILEGFERAGFSDMITIHIGDAKQTLAGFRAEMGLPGTEESHAQTAPGVVRRELYDMVYMDANKREYCEYYELVFDMVRPGGYILADNVLWDGKVCQDPLPQDKQTLGIARFNDMVAADPRVESVILPLRDGLNLIRKK
ncbi:MAG: O-methyltransferase [Bacteroidales bacterium]|nr:O-methyltransferase [Bacteroidales bacterium]